MKDGLKEEIVSWFKAVVYALIAALFITNVVIVNAEIPTGSMENNIMTDDRIVAFRLAYTLKDPERYDIVVFRFPDDETELYVKRVIGLPGEVVEIKDGKVYIDNNPVPLEDNFIKENTFDNWGPYEVPEGKYFMLGDNRNYSKDSRYWTDKFVDKKKLLGKVVFRYYPNFHIYRTSDIENIKE